METGEIINEKVYESPRMPPKISLRHDWMKELGSEVARQTEVNQPTQPNPNPNHDRTGRPVVTVLMKSIHVSLCDCKNTKLYVERLEKDKDTDKNVDAYHDRTERPVVIGQPTGSSTPFNEVDIDFQSIWIATCSCGTSRSIGYVGNTAKQCRLGLFQDSDFAGDLEDSKSTSGGNIVHFRKSYICSNKLDV